MQITRSSTEGATGKGPAECFTGDVYIDSVAGPAPAMSWTDTVVQVRRFLGCWTCVRRRPESVRRIGAHMDRQVVRYQRDDQEFGRAIGFFDATYALALTLLVTTLDTQSRHRHGPRSLRSGMPSDRSFSRSGSASQ
jgi:hypothetical protein